MIEIVLIVLAVSGMARIADADGQSGILWGAVTLVLCFASAALPLPMLRIGVAFLGSFLLLVAYKMFTDRR